DLVAAEDTRYAGKLLAHHHIRASLISYHEHNESERAPDLANRLRSGVSIALLSNAGTPTISDPGYTLIKACIAYCIPVKPVPGVSAAITALSVAGLATDAFVFEGFLPKKKAKRNKQLQSLAHESRTVVFYESPKRIEMLLSEIKQMMGDRYCVLAREMTKTHEEFIRGSASEILNRLRDRMAIKGECTLLVGASTASPSPPMAQIREAVRQSLSDGGRRLGDISKEIAKQFSVSKQLVYAEGLKIKKQIEPNRQDGVE
ncbi:MAG: 16S rRNA (cytidine(1402)-2'-O)-methyltransferase, partial [Deltaproteobacteria bacterium]|nr:16S rRNA (cytidine(1402)-2'-O)-methyltransferase [Deltaproteobacteria bacterium]